MCFENVIGIRSNCLPDSEPESGMYINQLPGISLKIAGDVADDEYRNGYAMLTDLRSLSAKMVVNEFGSKVRNHLRIAPLLELSEAGFWKEDDYLASEAANGGIEICKRQSGLSRVHIYRLRVLTDTTLNDKEIFIQDENGTQTFTVDLVAGVPSEIAINQYFSGPKIFIYWEMSDIEPNYSSLFEQQCTTAGCGTSSNYGTSINYRYAQVRGRRNTTAGTSKTYGISADFDISCDVETLLCKMKHTLYLPLLYKFGICFMEERIASTRFNAITGLMREDAEKGLMIFQAKYDALLDSFAMDAMPFLSQLKDDCVTCRTSKTVVAYV